MVMEQYLIHDTTLTDIADALRRKHGDTKTIIVEEAAPIVKISKTSNATGFDTFEGGHGNQIDKYEVITIPGAKSIKIDIGYQTENTNYDYVQIAAGSWPIAMPANIGKLGGSTLSKLSLEHPNTDTITIHFYSDTSNDTFLGYYAEIRGLDANGNFITEMVNKEKEVLNTYNPLDMADAIDNIPLPVVEPLEVFKNGTYTPDEGIDGFNPVTVNVGGGAIPEEALVITGSCQYRFYNDGWNWFIESFGNQITSKNITTLSNAFYNSENLTEIPFELNMSSISSYHSFNSAFYTCSSIKTLPKVNNAKPESTDNMFYGCKNLREIPFEFYENWDWSYMDKQTSGYSCNRKAQFSNCQSLRNLPIEFLKHASPAATYSYSMYNSMCNNCYALDEIVGLPIPYTATWTNNSFSSAFLYCSRLKDFTFALQDNGTPYAVKWRSQTIDLTSYVGYMSTTYISNLLNLNSGITEDTRVTDDATYQALKDNPDWWTTDIAYSRYNHDSAVATLNSLPDASAYLTGTYTNTIKFKGAAGSATDGGAINTLTEEEIAVATAKGWTVSLA